MQVFQNKTKSSQVATPAHELHSWRAGASLIALSLSRRSLSAVARAPANIRVRARVCVRVLYLLLFSSKLASLARQTQRQRQTANNKREKYVRGASNCLHSRCVVIVVVVFFYIPLLLLLCSVRAPFPAYTVVVVAVFQTTLAAIEKKNSNKINSSRDVAAARTLARVA